MDSLGEAVDAAASVLEVIAGAGAVLEAGGATGTEGDGRHIQTDPATTMSPMTGTRRITQE